VMDFIKSIAIAATGMRAQGRPHAHHLETSPTPISTATAPGGDPYRRRIVTFRSELDRELSAHVVGSVALPPTVRISASGNEPDNPVADSKGDVKYPNVNSLVEMTDLRDAQRSYEAILTSSLLRAACSRPPSISSKPR